ncbi:MAG TPA: endonuclease III [Actinomycetota bacterium]|nr:endonuclease III [Actinomycetota bacterium]
MSARPAREAPREDRAPEILRLLKREYRGATMALRYSSPLECLVAVILSAQCTDARVNEVTRGLFQKYRSAEDYLAVPESELAADIRPTGFFNQKAKSIRGTCRMIVEEYGGRVPDTMADLIRLPGVARKTANIVQGNVYPEKAARDPDKGVAVDTHVKRLSNRLGFSAESDPSKIERDLMDLLPRKEWFPITYVLIEHGRAVCKAPKPRCEECVVERLCPASRLAASGDPGGRAATPGEARPRRRRA